MGQFVGSSTVGCRLVDGAVRWVCSTGACASAAAWAREWAAGLWDGAAPLGLEHRRLRASAVAWARSGLPACGMGQFVGSKM